MSAAVRRAISSNLVRAAALGALIGLLLFAIAMIWRSARDDTIILEVQPAGDPNMLHVYVGGEVALPGVYRLERGSRVADAIAAAGGVTDQGDASHLGMAAPLADSDQIIVAARSPTPAPTSPSSVTPPVAGAQPATAPVNINLAGSRELDALPGIGPKLAERIIAYRTHNGPFQTIADLALVAGISERMVEDLRQLITVGP